MVKFDYGLSEIETELGKEILYDYQDNGRTSSSNALLGFSVGLNYVFTEIAKETISVVD